MFWAKSIIKAEQNPFYNSQCKYHGDGKYGMYLHRFLQDIHQASSKEHNLN